MKSLLLVPAFVLLAAFASTTDDVVALVKAEKLEQAFRLAEERALAGDHEGEESLAWFYDLGKYVAEDNAKALYWFRKAADAGLRHAQWRVGVMLDLGEGAEADSEEAFLWFGKSAAQGYREAFTSLGVMHAMGRGTPQDFSKSRFWYLRAARAGEPHGFYGVGMLHARGEGTVANPVEAKAWFLVAMTLGDGQARGALDEIRLDHDDMQAAVERANQIFREFGHTRRKIRFRNLDRERSRTIA